MRYSFVLLLVVASLTAVAQPKIEIVGGTKLDLGTINRGKITEKKVTVKNVGKDTLSLGRVEVSCGCTGTVVSENMIPPGKSGSILITFNSTNFTGPVHKYVTVNSNDNDNPRTQIEFVANVVQEVSVNPGQFWFRDAEVGKKSTATIVVQNQGKEDLVIDSYNTKLKGFSIKLPEKPIQPGQSAEIVAELDPKSAIVVLNDSVILKTNNTNQPQVYVYIYGNVKDFKF